MHIVHIVHRHHYHNMQDNIRGDPKKVYTELSPNRIKSCNGHPIAYTIFRQIICKISRTILLFGIKYCERGLICDVSN